MRHPPSPSHAQRRAACVRGPARLPTRRALPATGAGTAEVPVTGSIHANLVLYWAGQLGINRLVAFQASAHGGWLECELAGDRLLLVGQAVTFMEAMAFLPDAGAGVGWTGRGRTYAA